MQLIPPPTRTVLKWQRMFQEFGVKTEVAGFASTLLRFPDGATLRPNPKGPVVLDSLPFCVYIGEAPNGFGTTEDHLVTASFTMDLKVVTVGDEYYGPFMPFASLFYAWRCAQ